jgi:hypothetical protein
MPSKVINPAHNVYCQKDHRVNAKEMEAAPLIFDFDAYLVNDDIRADHDAHPFS